MPTNEISYRVATVNGKTLRFYQVVTARADAFVIDVNGTRANFPTYAVAEAVFDRAVQREYANA